MGRDAEGKPGGGIKEIRKGKSWGPEGKRRKPQKRKYRKPGGE